MGTICSSAGGRAVSLPSKAAGKGVTDDNGAVPADAVASVPGGPDASDKQR
jgi:hypothetical protein